MSEDHVLAGARGGEVGRGVVDDHVRAPSRLTSSWSRADAVVAATVTPRSSAELDGERGRKCRRRRRGSASSPAFKSPARRTPAAWSARRAESTPPLDVGVRLAGLRAASPSCTAACSWPPLGRRLSTRAKTSSPGAKRITRATHRAHHARAARFAEDQRHRRGAGSRSSLPSRILQFTGLTPAAHRRRRSSSSSARVGAPAPRAAAPPRGRRSGQSPAPSGTTIVRACPRIHLLLRSRRRSRQGSVPGCASRRGDDQLASGRPSTNKRAPARRSVTADASVTHRRRAGCPRRRRLRRGRATSPFPSAPYQCGRGSSSAPHAISVTFAGTTYGASDLAMYGRTLAANGDHGWTSCAPIYCPTPGTTCLGDGAAGTAFALDMPLEATTTIPRTTRLLELQMFLAGLSPRTSSPRRRQQPRPSSTFR